MKIAIMQPYLFPYIGYYQMVDCVDCFIFLDDVNFIKRGWINRNKVISTNKEEIYFTIPLDKVSQNKLINEVNISPMFGSWKKKFLKTLKHSYGKSPGFEETYSMIDSILSHDSNKICDIACQSIMQVSRRLGIDTEFLYSSDIGCAGAKEEKIINICKTLGANEYVNAIGGKSFYDKDFFSSHGVKLDFIRSTKTFEYMSIIHVMMNKFGEINLSDFILE